MRTEIGGGVEMMSHIEMEYAKTLKQVSQLERELAEVVAKERERCARVCEEFYSVENIAQKCAEAIRKGE
jgi:hypothetical protein